MRVLIDPPFNSSAQTNGSVRRDCEEVTSIGAQGFEDRKSAHLAAQKARKRPRHADRTDESTAAGAGGDAGAAAEVRLEILRASDDDLRIRPDACAHAVNEVLLRAVELVYNKPFSDESPTDVPILSPSPTPLPSAV